MQHHTGGKNLTGSAMELGCMDMEAFYGPYGILDGVNGVKA
ncbi:hypothetical protein SJI19_17735 [Acerihabitans sp. TG2]|nr:hypothetical protein [Acerihabitans sp. TG2]MEA9392359.1 hypothetical protein [Acerihabitans sp. TG2]